MSGMDKVKNTFQSMLGRGKRSYGGAVGNESLQAEGRADQAKGNLKQAGENVKDTFK